MKKLSIAIAGLALLTTGCVPKKKYAELEARHKQTEDLLNSATVKLNMCLDEKNKLTYKAESLENQNGLLKGNNQQLMHNMGSLTTLTQRGAENLEKSLESLREKDLTTKNLYDAATRRDSVSPALVQSLKGVLGNLDDQDVDIKVEKGVVSINILDKMLLSSGSYTISKNAKNVLEKVIKVVKSKSDSEPMVEGHIDDARTKKDCICDNWDLSVMCATEIVRALQNDFGIASERMITAGCSYYVPVASNTAAEGRVQNRRTRIVVLPKLDQFYTMIEEGMKDSAIGGKGE